jgi:hypothetical protein
MYKFGRTVHKCVLRITIMTIFSTLFFTLLTAVFALENRPNGGDLFQSVAFGAENTTNRGQALGQTPLETSAQLDSINHVVKDAFDAALANDADRFTAAFHPDNRKQAQQQLQRLHQIFSMTENLTFTPMIIMYDANDATVISKQFKPNIPNFDAFMIMGAYLTRHDGLWKVTLFSMNLPNTLPNFYSYWQEKHPQTKYWFDPDTPNWLRPEQNLQTNETIEQLTRIVETIQKAAEGHRKSLVRKVSAAAGGIEVFEAYFPADSEAAEKLDKWWPQRTKDGQVNEHSLALIKNGLRGHPEGTQRTAYRNEYIKWVGRNFISQARTQHTDAIDLLYHASFDPQLAYNCVYYGLSVIKPDNRTDKILKRLTELAMADIATGRICSATEGSRQEMLKYLQPYLDSSDPDISAQAQLLQKVFKGELDYNTWSREQYQKDIRRHFTPLLPQIRRILAEGSSKQRRDALNIIKVHGVSPLFDESFAEPFRACLLDQDPEVRDKALLTVGDVLGKKGQCPDETLALMDKLSKDPYFGVRRSAAKFIGGHWIWNVHPQNTKAIDLLIRLSTDKDHETRSNASYYGLSRIRDPNAIKHLIDLALAEQPADNDTYKVICWILRKSSKAKEIIQRYIDDGTRPTDSATKLYKDTFAQNPK